MKLRQRQLSAPKPISAAALRQRLYARPGLFAPPARLTRDDVGQNFRPRIQSRATSLSFRSLSLSLPPSSLSAYICYPSLPPPPISWPCGIFAPLRSRSFDLPSPLLPSRKTVRLTKSGSRKLRRQRGKRFSAFLPREGGEKNAPRFPLAHTRGVGKQTFSPSLPSSLSLSLGLFQIKS